MKGRYPLLTSFIHLGVTANLRLYELSMLHETYLPIGQPYMHEIGSLQAGIIAGSFVPSTIHASDLFFFNEST